MYFKNTSATLKDRRFSKQYNLEWLIFLKPYDRMCYSLMKQWENVLATALRIIKRTLCMCWKWQHHDMKTLFFNLNKVFVMVHEIMNNSKYQSALTKIFYVSIERCRFYVTPSQWHRHAYLFGKCAKGDWMLK